MAVRHTVECQQYGALPLLCTFPIRPTLSPFESKVTLQTKRKANKGQKPACSALLQQDGKASINNK